MYTEVSHNHLYSASLYISHSYHERRKRWITRPGELKIEDTFAGSGSKQCKICLQSGISCTEQVAFSGHYFLPTREEMCKTSSHTIPYCPVVYHYSFQATPVFHYVYNHKAILGWAAAIVFMVMKVLGAVSSESQRVAHA